MNIRTTIHQRLHQISKDELKTIINQSLNSSDESVLPGLGVLFEDFYATLDQQQQDIICTKLSSLLK